jgi:hypothetical protein
MFGEIIGMLFGLACFVGFFWAIYKFFQANKLKNFDGQRKASAEYGRIQREAPESADAKLTEAEFVDKFIDELPSPFKYMGIMFAIILVGFPVSCALAG